MNSRALKPEEIKVGMDVALWDGITDELKPLRRSTFQVKAIQLPFVAIAWPESGCSWLIDTRETRLVELSEEMARAMNPPQ